jgi:DNA-binding FadR family transcriptional regulator
VNTLKLSPIVVPKTSDVLANELRRQILSGELANGESLPPERELVAQTGLSRGSVREALRVLEAERLLSTRPGRFGGSTAHQPNDETLGRSMSLFVQGRGISLLALQQTREAVEPSMAALAAQNRTQLELAQLIEATEKVEAAFDDVPQFLLENVQWHCAIAHASHNELLRGFMFSLSSMVYKATAAENFATEAVRQQVIHAHRRVLQAIVSQDADLARQRMARHLAAVTAAFQAFPNAPALIAL